MAALTEEEAKIYDRQLRVWGVDAQKRMRAAHVLVVGTRALSAEVCKNLALAGIGALTLQDSAIVTESDLGAQFFLEADDIGKNRAASMATRVQVLNPMVRITVNTDALVVCKDAYFHTFDVVVLTDTPLAQQIRVNEICRTAPGKNIGCFTGETFGMFCYFFEDLHNHTYLLTRKVKKDKDAEETEETSTKVESYISLRKLIATPWKRVADIYGRRGKKTAAQYFAIQTILAYRDTHGSLPSPTEQDFKQVLQLRDRLCVAQEVPVASVPDDLLRQIAGQCTAELSPVCAIFGGLLGQEVLKCVSGKDAPHQNSVLYNALDGAAVVEKIAPA